jgi:hypothetical protein
LGLIYNHFSLEYEIVGHLKEWVEKYGKIMKKKDISKEAKKHVVLKVKEHESEGDKFSDDIKSRIIDNEIEEENEKRFLEFIKEKKEKGESFYENYKEEDSDSENLKSEEDEIKNENKKLSSDEESEENSMILKKRKNKKK